MFTTRILSAFSILSVVVVMFTANFASVQIDIVGPPGSDTDFTEPTVLPNGNIVLADNGYTPVPGLGGGTALGAVYLYNGATGSLISVMTGTNPGDSIGQGINILPNGNFFVSSPSFNGARGAVTLCSSIAGCPATINSSNSLVGSTPNDRVGSGVRRVLANGSFVTSTTFWTNAGAAEAGAVTLCSGTTGCAGVVGPGNSLVGTTAQDRVGLDIQDLSDGDYVVGTSSWDNGAVLNAGAAVWCGGTTGCTGPVTAANSLHGTVANSGVGDRLYPLSNGNYAVGSVFWTDGSAPNMGAVTFCTGATGCTGAVSSANSLVGANDGDFVGDVYELPSGAAVIESSSWQRGSQDRAGAVTFCADPAACFGSISESNSLVGSSTDDRVGIFGVTVLTNGNYVVQSATWQSNTGAATFCNGTTGCVGNVTQANSLTGGPGDSVGNNGLALPNGNYIVGSPGWDSGGANNVGAVTFCNGATGCVNMQVDATNSLVGIAQNDQIGGNGFRSILSNGNFVLRSPNAGAAEEGAVTFCNVTTGCPVGQISSSNSLVGSNADDRIGNSTIITLNNGNYVVLSRQWDRIVSSATAGGTTIPNAGAATFCDGSTGCTGFVSESNSLVGSTQDDMPNLRAVSLGENYVVAASQWDSPTAVDVGAVTFCNGTTGCSGPITLANSLTGTLAGDQVGNDGLEAFPNGDYAINSSQYVTIPLRGESAARKLNAGPILGGAVTYGDGTNGTTGQINSQNSVFGTASGNFFYIAYDPVNQQMLVGRADDFIVTLFRNTAPQTAPYDFDGDGRTDISVFRPSEGNWYINRSTAGFLAIKWGQNGDVLAPADYDGDGKTDIAVWRPGPPTQARFYILNSNNFSLTERAFGQTGDIPSVVGDWDGDGKADPAVYRDSAAGSQSRFFYSGSENNPGNNITFLNWGTTGDKPVRGDYDGDGILDLAVFRPSTATWWIRKSSDASVMATIFGLGSDQLVPGDYDGDGKTDVAVFRPSENNWYYLRSSNLEPNKFQWGAAGDILAPGDYDGDGRIDPSVFRPSDQTWYIHQTGSGTTAYSVFGLGSDVPVPSAGVN